jgi:hypothetical protein
MSLDKQKWVGAQASGATNALKRKEEGKDEESESAAKRAKVDSSLMPPPPSRPPSAAEEKKKKTKRIRVETDLPFWFADVPPHEEPALSVDDNHPFTLESIIRLFAENMLANYLRRLFGHAQRCVQKRNECD